MNFVDAVKNTTVETRTENGMRALESSLDACVDLFFKIGAMRGQDIRPAFERAMQDDSEIAMRIALWSRDIRGGAGERQLFRNILRHMEVSHPEKLTTNFLEIIPVVGRWDDLLAFEDVNNRYKSYGLISDALFIHKDGLCAKWMPRKGPIAEELRKFLGLSPKRYRKTLVELTKVVENQMCAKNWGEINYSHVPSRAMTVYRKAFKRNDEARFVAYLDELRKPKEQRDPSVKVNASAVYPYDVIRAGGSLSDSMWEALPNYMGDGLILPVVDVSGSMTLSCSQNLSAMDVAVSLGLYCADKSRGPFKDLFVTFSEKPSFQHLKGTLSQKLTQMKTSEWGMSTNLHAVFDEILRIATTNSLAQEDMPSTVLILSDMQFDHCIRYDDSAIQMIRRKYEDAGYRVPNVVFWNIRDGGNVPVSVNDKGVALVSGFSPSIMEAILKCDESFTPRGIMLQAISKEKYDFTNR